MRLAAILLCSIGACLLLIGSITGSWFTVDDQDESQWAEGRERPSSFGLRSAEVCEETDFSLLFGTRHCRSVSYDDIGAADSESIAIMRITEALGIFGCLFLTACAILIGIGVRGERGFALGGAVVSAACFLAAIGLDVVRPRLLVELDASVGSSFYLYLLGAVGGFAGGICGIRLRAAAAAVDLPGDPRAHFPPELSAPPPPGAPRTAIPTPVPLPSPPVEPRPCPRCGNAARWVPGYRRHYCDACQAWL